MIHLQVCYCWQVVENYGKEFRESDVISTFTSIAKWKDSSGNTDVLHSKPFQTLVGKQAESPMHGVSCVCMSRTV